VDPEGVLLNEARLSADILPGETLPTPGSPASLSRPRTRLSVLVAVGSTLTWSVTPQFADARVNPLVVIERQIRKANMLIVLDTSGSMNGVPGGQFQNSAECGVDCDNG